MEVVSGINNLTPQCDLWCTQHNDFKFF